MNKKITDESVIDLINGENRCTLNATLFDDRLTGDSQTNNPHFFNLNNFQVKQLWQKRQDFKTQRFKNYKHQTTYPQINIQSSNFILSNPDFLIDSIKWQDLKTNIHSIDEQNEYQVSYTVSIPNITLTTFQNFDETVLILNPNLKLGLKLVSKTNTPKLIHSQPEILNPNVKNYYWIDINTNQLIQEKQYLNQIINKLGLDVFDIQDLSRQLRMQIMNQNVQTILQNQIQNIGKHTDDIIKQRLNTINNIANQSPNFNLGPALIQTMHDYAMCLKYAQGKTVDPKHIQSNYQKALTIAQKHHIKQPDIEMMTTQSLHFMLDHELAQISSLGKQNKIQTISINDPKNQILQQLIKETKPYSKEQQAIIKSTKSMLVGIAGAGTGKSATLIGRLEYLKRNHFPLDKILAFSFTKAGAENLEQRYHEIKSRTLAQIISTEYQKNFPKQIVSTDRTLYNQLRMTYHQYDPQTQKEIIRPMFTILNKFSPSRASHQEPDIEGAISLFNQLLIKHYDQIIQILDGLHETTLSIQPVIMYRALVDHHPFHKTSTLNDFKYIIVDETQDLSVFEYILIMRLASINHAAIMIIGDASQTLYEFRNADPDFLNTLETDPNFSKYHLHTNYRSNQAILNVANELLQIIKANQASQIQLENFKKPTISKEEFLKHIQLYAYPCTNDNPKPLINQLTNDLHFINWIHHSIDNHQTIAILAPRRKFLKPVATLAKQIAVDYIGNVNDIYLPTDVYTYTDISNAMVEMIPFINSLDPKQTNVNTLRQNFTRYLILNRESQYSHLPYELEDTYNQIWDSIQLKQAILTAKQTNNPEPIANYLRTTLLFLEDQYNQEQQAKATEDVKSRFKQDLNQYDLVYSTIHSAKGLEFDNVILIHNEPTRKQNFANNYHQLKALTPEGLINQSDLRLLMVGLTRAKKNEFLIDTFNYQNDNPMNYTTDQRAMFLSPLTTAYVRVGQKIAKGEIN